MYVFLAFAPPFAAFNSSIIDPMEFILIQVLQVHIAKYCLIRFQFSVREMRYSNSTLTFFQKLLTFVLVNLTNHKPDSLLAPCPFHSSAACPAILALTPLFQSPCPKYLVFARSGNLIVCFLGEPIARQSACGFI